MMSKNQLTGTATQPQRNRKFCQFNNDQYCKWLTLCITTIAITLSELPWSYFIVLFSINSVSFSLHAHFYFFCALLYVNVSRALTSFSCIFDVTWLTSVHCYIYPVSSLFDFQNHLIQIPRLPAQKWQRFYIVISRTEHALVPAKKCWQQQTWASSWRNHHGNARSYQ